MRCVSWMPTAELNAELYNIIRMVGQSENIGGCPSVSRQATIMLSLRPSVGSVAVPTVTGVGNSTCLTHAYCCCCCLPDRVLIDLRRPLGLPRCGEQAPCIGGVAVSPPFSLPVRLRVLSFVDRRIYRCVSHQRVSAMWRWRSGAGDSVRGLMTENVGHENDGPKITTGREIAGQKCTVLTEFTFTMKCVVCCHFKHRPTSLCVNDYLFKNLTKCYAIYIQCESKKIPP